MRLNDAAKRAEVVVLHHGQPLAVVTGRHSFGAVGEVPDRSQRR